MYDLHHSHSLRRHHSRSYLEWLYSGFLVGLNSTTLDLRTKGLEKSSHPVETGIGTFR
jgi:hypothetical protein